MIYFLANWNCLDYKGTKLISGEKWNYLANWTPSLVYNTLLNYSQSYSVKHVRDLMSYCGIIPVSVLPITICFYFVLLLIGKWRNLKKKKQQLRVKDSQPTHSCDSAVVFKEFWLCYNGNYMHIVFREFMYENMVWSMYTSSPEK